VRASEITDPDWLVFYLAEAHLLDVHLVSDWPSISDAVKGIHAEVIAHRRSQGFQPQRGNRYRRYLEKIILDLLVATVEGKSPYVSVSLNKNDYKAGGRLEQIYLGSYRAFVAVVNSLKDLGYIHVNPGFYGEKKRRARIAATDKLLDVVPFDADGVRYDWRNTELVRLKNDDGIYIDDWAETPYSKSVRKVVEQYNELAEKTDIRLDGKPVIKKYQHAVFHGENMRRPLLGRMYGGVPQNLHTDKRPYLKINGEGLVNLDFKAHHIRIACNLEGVDPGYDPYVIPEVVSGVLSREEVKDAVNIMLNAKDRKQAVRAVGQKSIVEAVERAHPMLCGYSVLGKRLQKEDADLMRGVLSRLVENGIYAINLHDGLLCRESDMQFVYEVMKQEYQSRYNFYPVIEISPPLLIPT
jgi:hypothetical protein